MDDLISIALAKKDLPIPYETKPTSNDLMVKYGFDNLYPLFLLSLYSKCPIHQSVINTKASYIIGGGLKAKDGSDLNININPIDSMNEFLDKIVKDFLIFNTFCVETQYNSLTFASETLAYYHIPAHSIRTNKDKTKFWYSEDWILKKQAQWIYERWQKDNPDPQSKLFYYDGYIPTNQRTYPEPEYSACLEAISTNIAIQAFNRNNIQNNFSPSKLITYYLGENVPKPIQDEIKYKLNKHFSGEGEKWMLVFANPGQEKIKIDNIDANTWDQAYQVTREASKDDIYEGHGINPSLMGKSTAGKLGNTQELELSYEIFKSNYIQSKRLQIESALSMLFKQEVEFVDKALFKTRISEATREKILTINELRQLDGLSPIEGGDKFISAPAQSQNQPVQVVQSIQQNEILSNQDINEEDLMKIEKLGFQKKDWIYLCEGNKDTLNTMRQIGGEKLNIVITLMYEYLVRPDVEPVISESRIFCKTLEKSNKYYSRADIQQMSNILGYDVLKYGGHFYTNPKTGITTEQCRHYWKSVIVKENR